MRVSTAYWGEVEASYWRDDKGNEGLRATFPQRNIPPSIIASDLAQPLVWPALMREGAKNYGQSMPENYIPIPQVSTGAVTPTYAENGIAGKPAIRFGPAANAEDKAQAARDRMAKARAARGKNKEQQQ